MGHFQMTRRSELRIWGHYFVGPNEHMIPLEIVPKIRSNGLYFRFQRCNLILGKKKKNM